MLDSGRQQSIATRIIRPLIQARSPPADEAITVFENVEIDPDEEAGGVSAEDNSGSSVHESQGSEENHPTVLQHVNDDDDDENDQDQDSFVYISETSDENDDDNTEDGSFFSESESDIEYVAKSMHDQLVGGIRGCSAEDHEANLQRHMDEVDNHNTLVRATILPPTKRIACHIGPGEGRVHAIPPGDPRLCPSH